MSATTTPTTFSDLFTDVLNRVRGDTTRTTDLNLAKRYVNMGLQDLHIQQNWPWAERTQTLRTHKPYSTGSVSVQAASRLTLEGTNTAWNTVITGLVFTNVRTNGKLVIAGDDEPHAINSVTSDTSAALRERYLGNVTTASTYAAAYANYTYFEDEYDLASDFWRLVDTRSFSTALDIPILGRQEFYRRYPANKSPGSITVCTILESVPAGGTSATKRVVFHPPPDDYYTIPYRYITTYLANSAAGAGQANLSADDDVPIIPLQYRHVLIFFATAQWYRDRKDDTRSQEANAEYVDLVKRMANDSIPERDVPRLKGARSRYLQRTAGPLRRPSGSRFTTGTAWDELRE